MDHQSRRLYTSIHLPGNSTPQRMMVLMTLQGHSFERNGQLIVDSPYRPPHSELPYIVRYSFREPPSQPGKEHSLRKV